MNDLRSTFAPNMKRLKFPKLKPTSAVQEEEKPVGSTLDRIVNAKEEARRKWTEEQEEFQRRRHEHEMKMIDMEKAEVVRREEEIRRRNDELDETRRKHRLVQEKIVDQLRMLQAKLDEVKIEHKMLEEKSEDEIAGLEDTLCEVKHSLEIRVKDLGVEMPTAPPPDSECGSMSMYPTLPVPLARNSVPVFPKSASGGGFPTSAGSSPQISQSSRSETPNSTGKTDSECSV